MRRSAIFLLSAVLGTQVWADIQIGSDGVNVNLAGAARDGKDKSDRDCSNVEIGKLSVQGRDCSERDEHENKSVDSGNNPGHDDEKNEGN